MAVNKVKQKFYRREDRIFYIVFIGFLAFHFLITGGVMMLPERSRFRK